MESRKFIDSVDKHISFNEYTILFQKWITKKYIDENTYTRMFCVSNSDLWISEGIMAEAESADDALIRAKKRILFQKNFSNAIDETYYSENGIRYDPVPSFESGRVYFELLIDHLNSTNILEANSTYKERIKISQVAPYKFPDIGFNVRQNEELKKAFTDDLKDFLSFPFFKNYNPVFFIATSIQSHSAFDIGIFAYHWFGGDNVLLLFGDDN